MLEHQAIVSVDATLEETATFLRGVRARVEDRRLHESLDDMVTQVLKLDLDCIPGLDIVGHGREGNISVGGGEYSTEGKRINGVDEWVPDLSKLKGRFCKGAGIRLLGCSTGVGDKGLDKLGKIADLLDIPVTGTTRNIYSRDFDKNGFKGGKGDLVTVNPGERPRTKKGEPAMVSFESQSRGLGRLEGIRSDVKATDILAIGLGDRPNLGLCMRPIQGIRLISRLIKLIDFDHAYEGDGLATLKTKLIHVLYKDFCSETWSLVLSNSAIAIQRGTSSYLFPIRDVAALEKLIADMDVIQKATQRIARIDD